MADDSRHAFSHSLFIFLAPKIINTLWNSWLPFLSVLGEKCEVPESERKVANTQTHTHTRTHTDLALSSIWCMTYAITTIWAVIKWTILHRNGPVEYWGLHCELRTSGSEQLHGDRCFHISPDRRISPRLVQTSVTRCVAICGWPPKLEHKYSLLNPQGTG